MTPEQKTELLKYCTTDKQREHMQAWVDHGTQTKAAKALGVLRQSITQTVDIVKKKAAVSGYAPDHDYNHSVPEPFIASGVSTYYDKEGQPKGQWVKSKLSHEKYLEMLQHCADQFYADLPKLPPTKFKHKKFQTDIIPWFQIGDAHLGMLSHSSEVGTNFDLKIATTELMSAFKILFDECTPGERCVINDLGDFTHYENYSATTEASGHALDADGRFPKMIQCYIPIMRFIIEEALTKFKVVDIIVNQGNHSRTNDIWMRFLLSNVYDKDSRVNVLDNSNVFIPYRMGNTFVMTHHSDKCKVQKLAQVMATDYAEHWGQCDHRYIDTGHVHHGFASKEHPGVLIESWNNLATHDKYAHEGGWRSRQSITRVDRSRKYGNVGRRTLSLDEIRDRIAAGMTKHKVKGYNPKQNKKVHTV